MWLDKRHQQTRWWNEEVGKSGTKVNDVEEDTLGEYGMAKKVAEKALFNHTSIR